MLFKLVSLWILGFLPDVSTVTWKDVETMSSPSLTPEAPTVIRADNDTLTLKWTVDPVRDTVRGVSVRLLVQQKSTTAQTSWLNLTSNSIQVAIQPRNSSSVTFSRDLEIVPGEYYKAEVTLLPNSLDSMGTAYQKTAPLSPSSVQVITLRSSSMSISIHFRRGRVDAYWGRVETQTVSTTAGIFQRSTLPTPLYDDVTITDNITVTLALIPGETYRVYIVSQSWHVPAESETASKNLITIAPARPIITVIRRLSNTSINLGWTLPEGKAERFLLYINGAPQTTPIEPVTQTPYSSSLNVTSLDPNGFFEIAMTSLSRGIESDRSKIVTYSMSSGKSITMIDYRTEVPPVDKGMMTEDDLNSTRADEDGTECLPWPWVISGMCLLILVLILLIIIIWKCKSKAVFHNSYTAEDHHWNYLHPVNQHNQRESSPAVEDVYSDVH